MLRGENGLWRAEHANGRVSPLGLTTHPRVCTDPDLLQFDEVWAAAGTWNDNVGAATADIVRVVAGMATT